MHRGESMRRCSPSTHLSTSLLLSWPSTRGASRRRASRRPPYAVTTKAFLSVRPVRRPSLALGTDTWASRCRSS